jgi:dipeptide transport system ATP-binding protein
MSLLEIQDLSVEFGAPGSAFKAVKHVSFSVEPGEVLGIVGESGSGKSVTMMALMGLLDENARINAKSVRFKGQDLLSLSASQKRKIYGKDIAMIFQDPMTSLNPSYTVGYQINEVLRAHLGLRGAQARKRALELLELVEMPAAASRLDNYPHQLSGGMSQRVMIAMALAGNPSLLIADEPTTALDVTIQAQILDLLVDLQRERNMALIMITHDLAVVSQVAQRVQVMYGGTLVETQSAQQLFQHPTHPYTEALLRAIPERSHGAERLYALPGMVPGKYDQPAGCILSPRCPYAQPRCHTDEPPMVSVPRADGSQALTKCFYPLIQGGQA